MGESLLNERVEEIVWKIKTLDEDELAELHRRLGDEFALPSEPDELSKREPVLMPPNAEDLTS
jgi:hypothetical protein